MREESGHVNGIHDLGGRHGFGEVIREPEERGLHAPWEGRVHALVAFVLGIGATTVDAFRHGIERLDPTRSLTQHSKPALRIGNMRPVVASTRCRTRDTSLHRRRASAWIPSASTRCSRAPAGRSTKGGCPRASSQ